MGRKTWSGMRQSHVMAIEKKVGIPARRTKTIGELSTERAGVKIDPGGDTIMTHFASSCGSSMETSFYLDDLIFSDADDGITNEDYITAK